MHCYGAIHITFLEVCLSVHLSVLCLHSSCCNIPSSISKCTQCIKLKFILFNSWHIWTVHCHGTIHVMFLEVCLSVHLSSFAFTLPPVIFRALSPKLLNVSSWNLFCLTADIQYWDCALSWCYSCNVLQVCLFVHLSIICLHSTSCHILSSISKSTIYRAEIYVINFGLGVLSSSCMSVRPSVTTISPKRNHVGPPTLDMLCV